MRFLIDMPLPPSLAKLLHAEGHEAVHASEIGLHRAPDSQIIVYAASERRTIVTADHDFPRLLMAMDAAGASAILFRGGELNNNTVFVFMRRALVLLDEKDERHFLMTVDHNRVRRRWLEPSSPA